MNTPRGHIVSRRALLAFGMTRHSIARAVARGELLRLRQGWYATPSADPSAMRAVTVGGVATSLSATELLGLWTPRDSTLHVAVPQNAGRLRGTTPRRSDGAKPICLHWRNHGSPAQDGVASVVDALIDTVQCQPEDYAVVVIDSALNKGLVTLRQLEAAFERLPRRYARALGRADGRSQSGTETLVRLRLRALGIRVSVQVRISGVGCVDLVVGDRFVLECDSREFHTGQERYHGDRLRDRKLIKLGYLPMRLTYEMIMFDWPETLKTILSRVRRREHLWPRRSKSGKTASRRAKTHDEDGSS
jgi:very-short-patch-repair endonuclease